MNFIPDLSQILALDKLAVLDAERENQLVTYPAISSELSRINERTQFLGNMISVTNRQTYVDDLKQELDDRSRVLEDIIINLESLISGLDARYASGGFITIDQLMSVAAGSLIPTVQSAYRRLEVLLGQYPLPRSSVNRYRTDKDILVDDFMRLLQPSLFKLLWDYSPRRTVFGPSDARFNTNVRRIFPLLDRDTAIPNGDGVLLIPTGAIPNVSLTASDAIAGTSRMILSGEISFSDACNFSVDSLPNTVAEIILTDNTGTVTSDQGVANAVVAVQAGITYSYKVTSSLNSGQSTQFSFSVNQTPPAAFNDTVGFRMSVCIKGVIGETIYDQKTLVDWLYDGEDFTDIVTDYDTAMAIGVVSSTSNDMFRNMWQWVNDRYPTLIPSQDIWDAGNLFDFSFWRYIASLTPSRNIFTLVYNHFYDCLKLRCSRVLSSNATRLSIETEI
jgi:hypothetical protein